MTRWTGLSVPRTRGWGLVLALAAACLSGVAVFVNAAYVGKVGDPTAFTTAKNAVAALVLLAALAGRREGVRRPAAGRPGRRQWAGLLALGVLGGSVPFVLFFEGLARTSSPVQAGFLHKTLVVWVALLAVPLLHERFTAAHAGAVALLVAGQVVLVGSVGPGLDQGERMVLAATLLWSVEFVLAKRLLAGLPSSLVAAARLGIGVVLLGIWVVASGRLDDLAALGAREWRWALVTGVLLAGFVTTWYAGLQRAQAVDVTAVLVAGQLVTAALSAARGESLPDAGGLALLGLGVLVALAGALRAARPVPALP